jgi:hypothetical protein
MDDGARPTAGRSTRCISRRPVVDVIEARPVAGAMLFRAYRDAGRNSDIAVNFHDKAATLKKAGRAPLPEVRAARKAGLDPDLPPPVLHRLAMISSP